jgi:hypothetical protein
MNLAMRVVVLLLVLSAGSLGAMQQVVKTPRDGVYTNMQADRGGLFYLTYCSNCHGGDLAGREGPPLVGDAFRKRSAGRTFDDLITQIERMQISLTTPSHLDIDTSVDILAFILSKNGYPHGDAELPADREALRLMKSEVAK